MFQRQFNFIGENDHHRSLLQHFDRAGRGEAVGGQPFARAVQDARRQRRHRHATETEHHRQHGAAVEADQCEQPVGDYRQARQAALPGWPPSLFGAQLQPWLHINKLMPAYLYVIVK